MIKYNLETINDWFYSTDNIIKVYRNNAICYYKIDSSSPSGQTPCFAVVDDISQYSDTEFEDVFNKADNKWYKLNNLNEYEEYGVYGSGRTITTYDGKLTIDEEITPSRLPAGYTEVEYIQNTGTSYINTDYYPNQDTRIVADMQVVTYNTYGRLLGAGNHNTANTISCDYADSSNIFEISWGGYTGWSQYTVSSSFSKYDKHTYDWNKNNFYIDGALFDTKAFKSFTCSYKLGIFNVLESNNQPTSNTGRYFYGKLYSFKIYDNDILVRDFVPAKRDSDSKYGLYDVVNDVFYISPNNNSFIGGSEIVLTATCEYQYSGGSWVNLGEVSGSTYIEYLERDSSHNGYVPLGEYFQTNTRIQIDFQMTQAKGFAIIGDYFNNDNDDWRVFLNYDSQVNNWLVYDFTNSRKYYNTGDWSKRFNIEIGNYYIKDLDSGNYLINTTAKTSFSRPNQMYLFNLVGTIPQQNLDYGHIYSVKIYQNNVLVKDYIPWTDGNGNYGLYDKVSSSATQSTGSMTGATSSTTEYPKYYDEIQDPPNNLVFSSMAEAEAYECPWVGMRATIDGSGYTFSGDAISGYEWVLNPYSLPDVPFVLNYNAKNYDATTHSISQTSGQTKEVDAICNYNPNNIIDNSSNGYVSVTGNTRLTISGGTTSLARSNNQTGCTMTIVSKARTDNVNESYSIITNRGSYSDMNWMWRYPANGIFLHGSSSYNKVTYYTPTSASPITASVRVSWDGSVKQQINDWTNNGSYSGAFQYGSTSNSGALFCDYLKENAEFWKGDFYWVYMSHEVLTDEQIQQVIDYNENL